jgi:hypothetical protein
METRTLVPVETFFAALARFRRGRAVHPGGTTFAGRLTVTDSGTVLPAGTYDVVVRLTKGAGTPGSWPDVLGIALRVAVHESPSRCDFLFSSAGTGRWTRWLPVPAHRWDRASYTTLGPYQSSDSVTWLMLTPEQSAEAPSSSELPSEPVEWQFGLRITGRRPDWRVAGRLCLRTAPIVVEGLTFDPVLNHPAGAVPGPGWLRRLREAAYQGSRRGRAALPP